MIHTSHQNLVLLPSPTLICKFASNLGHKFLIALQTPAPYAFVLTLLHQNPSSPHLYLVKSFHKGCLSFVYLHNHFIKRLLLCFLKSLMPKPPLSFLCKTVAHLTKLYPLFSLQPCQRKSLLSLSNFLTTFAGIVKRD